MKKPIPSRRKKFSIAVSIACALAIVCVAAALFSVTSDVAKSTIKSSDLGIELVMLESDGSGGEKPSDETTQIVPGNTVSRIAKVKNTGSQDAWVRVKVALVNGDKIESITDTQSIGLEGLNTGDSGDWEYRDGFFYYKKPLKAGETSEALFTGVTISGSVDTDFDGSNLKVDAQGTQYKNNGNTVLDAQGWPSN